MKLYIGNMNYSSWSLRPWLAMQVMVLDFDTVLVPFDVENGNPCFREFSPTGKVPVLQDGDLTIWDSLAILEYVAERFPDCHWWPDNQSSRALARCAANEMHSGFIDLRSSCPMNMRRPTSPIPLSSGVKTDLERIDALWQQCLDDSGGPFLFGEFSIADAMFAPVVSRIQVYDLPVAKTALGYCEQIKKLPAWQEWENAAREEPWVCQNVEI